MEKLTEILKDLEQGKISADNAEEQVLRLFGVSINLSQKEREEQERQQFLKDAREHWNARRKLDAVKCVRYAYEYLDLRQAVQYCEKHFC